MLFKDCPQGCGSCFIKVVRWTEKDGVYCNECVEGYKLEGHTCVERSPDDEDFGDKVDDDGFGNFSKIPFSASAKYKNTGDT